MPLTMANQIFHISFYIFPIHGANLMLGVQWLQTLHAVLFDQIVPSIQFTHNSLLVTLIGNTSISIALQPINNFSLFIFIDTIQFIHTMTWSDVCYSSLADELSSVGRDFHSFPQEIISILTQFAIGFDIPKDLPLYHIQDHNVPFIPYPKLVNI